MEKSKTNIIVVDKNEKKYDNKGNDNNGGGNNDNKKIRNNRSLIIIILLVGILVAILFVKKSLYNGNTNVIHNREPKLYSDLYKELLNGSIKPGERPISMLDEDIELWVQEYGLTTFLISYNELIASSVNFISDEFKNQYQVLVELSLYDNFHNTFSNTEECINVILKKLKDKNCFNNYLVISDFKDINQIYIVNKDRIVSVNEVENEVDHKPYLKIELSNNTVINTRIDYRDLFRDKINNEKQFTNDLNNMKTILNANGTDFLSGVVMYNDTKHSMLYLYKKHVGVTQSISSIFNEKQKKEFFGVIGKVAGELINIDDKIIINPKLINSIKYDGLYVSINLDGGYNSLVEKIKISQDAKNKLDELAKEKNIEIKDNYDITSLNKENSKVMQEYKDNGKEFIGEDQKIYYKHSLEQLKEILNKHNKDVLNAVVIDKDNNKNVILYYFKNSEFEVKPLLFSFSASQKQEFFWEIEKKMGDILILDDKILLNPKLIREVIYDLPYTTIYLDGGLNSILNNLNLSQGALKELKEWQKQH